MRDDPELLFALVYWLSQGIGAAPDDPVLGAITLSLLWGHPRTSVQRRAKLQPNGLTEPFCYMGPLEYLRHSGDTPISIVWRLKHPMPPAVFEMAHRLVI